ncbi:hypothetical protein J2X69_004229 [Algoriphagus sp. 4150]|uniref:hypothetical protein n=1 Tax=Algoriphagus sp. 4150 TaxID=2817756 RepID=UPI00285D3685|nr:hypothetical protein [Algoriphagus sp. 4150]MDR7131864.1 hypothetical protein [Algoriphagus sp. 4150]
MENIKHQKEWITIPSLPCISIEETLSFWQMLGFEITYKQTRPYQYGVVQRGGSELHFGRVKGMEAESNLDSGCLVQISDIEYVYKEFTTSFKEHLGKVPNSGIPRISRMKPGATRFSLTDVSGNYIIFIDQEKMEADQKTYEKADDKNQSPLRKAIATAIRFRDYKEDDKAAAKTLDVALKKAENEAPTDIAEALLIRIDLAGNLNDPIRGEECKTLLSEIDLQDEERERLTQKHNSTL